MYSISSHNKLRISLLLSLVLLFFSLVLATPASAANYINLNFEDGQGDPIITALDIRVSLWDAYDVRSEDVDGNGDIYTSALHYGDYQTTFTITPDGNDYFTPPFYGHYQINTADLPIFPDPIGADNLFVQVEYKNQGDPNTSYQVYDFVDDPPWQNITRHLLVDNISFVTYDGGPRTNNNTFTLDANNNATTEIKLEFGETLAESLQWSIASERFELSDDLDITGNLTLTGTADGRDIAADGTTLDSIDTAAERVAALNASAELVDEDNIASAVARDSELTTHSDTTSGVHGTTGDVIGTTDTQTLTNKTIDADSNTVTNIEDANIKAGANINADKLTDGATNAIITLTQKSDIHSQNTDTGSTTNTFTLDSDDTGGSASLKFGTGSGLGGDLSYDGGNFTLNDDLNVGSNKITNLAAPTTGSDAVTKDYVDTSIDGLDWQESVLDRFDPTSGLPGSPDEGDRYIATATANGWTDKYIYEYRNSSWTEIIPNEGNACRVEDEDIEYVYNGTTWVSKASSTDHNNLLNLQGGTTDEFYHLTNAQHTEATGFFGTTDITGSEAETLTDSSDASSLHIHDGQYYTETEVDTTVGNRTYTEDNYVTDSESVTASVDALDQQVKDNADLAHTQNTDTGSTTNAFTLDSDDTGGNVELTFGTTLSEKLYWDSAGTKFVFTDDVNILDNLDVDGIIYAGSGGEAITNADGTVKWSGLETRSKKIALSPEYAGATFQADGSNNSGSFDAGYDGTNYHNYYSWTTTQGTLQDYDTVVRVQLPDDFVSWDASNPLTFEYQTTDAVTTNNKLDIVLVDTANATASLTGNTALASATWATYSSTDDLSGGTWTAGSWITIKVTTYALTGKTSYAGEIVLKYNGK